MSETINISKMASYVSNDIFKFFKWGKIEYNDLNFSCVQPDHYPNNNTRQYTHPVDAVFYYIDPYTNKKVFFNTDFKSYSSKSINSGAVRTALISLAKTIDCAALSDEWLDVYNSDACKKIEIRGMLFIYNHDKEYDRDFYDFFDKGQKSSEKDLRRSYINPKSIGVRKNQWLHIIEPKLIEYLCNIVGDIRILRSEDDFPKKDYIFFYPDLVLNKAKNDEYDRPATIEVLTGPFVIIKHPAVNVRSIEDDKFTESCPAGYIIYMNSKNVEYKEFMYLFDKLSSYQVLNKENRIRIRLPSDAPSNSFTSFDRAIKLYSKAWGYDEYKKSILEAIEIKVVQSFKYNFLEQEFSRD